MTIMPGHKPARHIRRRIEARNRTTIRKGEAFGRIKILAIETGSPEIAAELGIPAIAADRIVYRHHGRGVVDRRLSDALLDSLVA